MEFIFETKGTGFSIKTAYNKDSGKFETFIEYYNGKTHTLENFQSASMIIKIHEHWCRYTGLLKSSFNVSQVKKHLTNIA